MSLPILYSFVRCPYAIRARMACSRAQTDVEIREVNLKDKPAELLQASPKGTVPVFVHPDGRIIDESADIVKQQLASIAIPCGDPLDQTLIEALHKDFIPALQRYKYPDRYPGIDHNRIKRTLNGFLIQLNEHLIKRDHGDKWGYLDIMLLPLIRQCYIVNINEFNSWGHTTVSQWLQDILCSQDFKTIMQKQAQWKNPSIDQ